MIWLRAKGKMLKAERQRQKQKRKMTKQKKKIDPRHKKRQKIIRELFSWSFLPHQELSSKTKNILKKSEDIDKEIKLSAPKWPISKINKIDLAILRLAVYELKYNPQLPTKVAINEAVELGKEYGSENSPSFINGVLGDVYDRLKD
jgi:transcription antitermination protein NusB